MDIKNIISKLSVDENTLLEAFLESLHEGNIAPAKITALAAKIKMTGAKAMQELITPMGLGFKHIWEIEHRGTDGRLLDYDMVKNITVNVGLNEILDKFWKGSSYTAAYFLGQTEGTPTFAAADTMSSHGGWVEDAGYTESVRQTITLGTVASQSVDNSASKAVFTANGAQTWGGGFISPSSTKSETASVLIGGTAYSADKVLADTETLTVTVTLTASSV